MDSPISKLKHKEVHIMNQIINDKDSRDFKQFCSIKGLSPTISKKKIKAAKLELSKALTDALKIQDLKPLEQDYINQIMARTISDNVGKYIDRYNTVTSDYFLICGILYNHMTLNSEHTSNKELNNFSLINDLSDEII